jgi:predicted DNA-binding transcriptional regulator AlpA
VAKSNGVHEDPDAGMKLLQTVEAASYCGLTRPTFQRWVADKVITPVKTEGSIHWFALADLEVARASLGNAANEGGSPFAQVLSAYAEREKVLLEHEQKLLKLIVEPTQEVLKVLKEENIELRKHNMALYEAAETAKSEQQARDLALMEFQGMQANREKAFEMLRAIAGQIALQVRSSGEVAKLVQSLTNEQIEMLGSVVNPEQYQALQAIRGTAAQPPVEEKPQQEKES